MLSVLCCLYGLSPLLHNSLSHFITKLLKRKDSYWEMSEDCAETIGISQLVGLLFKS